MIYKLSVGALDIALALVVWRITHHSIGFAIIAFLLFRVSRALNNIARMTAIVAAALLVPQVDAVEDNVVQMPIRPEGEEAS